LVNANTAIRMVGVALGFLFVQEFQHADTGTGEKQKKKDEENTNGKNEAAH
jgi:hypothetical protein